MVGQGPVNWAAGERDGLVLLAARGELNLGAVGEARAVLTKWLLDRGRVILDLSELRVNWFPALMVLPAALANAGGWPLARLVLLRPDRKVAEYLEDTTIARVVPVAGDWRAAVGAITRRPRRVNRRTELPPSDQAVEMARAAARSTCADWELADLCGLAEAVTAELVDNAVRHAGTTNVLGFTLTERGLYVRVTDHAPAGDVPLRAVGGLRVVETLTQQWGVSAHAGGKTVWALI